MKDERLNKLIDHEREDAEWRQFNYTKDEETVCKRFGCGKKLTPEEKLYGTLCISCQRINHKPIDIVDKFISE